MTKPNAITHADSVRLRETVGNPPRPDARPAPLAERYSGVSRPEIGAAS